MAKILTTIGPQSAKNINSLKFCLNKSNILRFNLSHNEISWHKKKIDIIKKIDSQKIVLVDIPGAKPRTMNVKPIDIKKGQIVNFGYKVKNSINIIPVSNPLPKIESKNLKFFSLSDGSFLFKFINFKNGLIRGKSLQDFKLLQKKGLNIPNSIYSDEFQSDIYLKFLKKISHLKYDCVGLSFIQNGKIIKKLKRKFNDKIIISKIENFLGYQNRIEIIEESDGIMIDRGDLAAEVGNEMLTEYCEKIIDDCKKFGKPVIIATENLNSLIENITPSKSDILNLDYYNSKNVDFIMLSDETATSTNWKNTLNWLNNHLSLKKIKFNFKKKFNLEKIFEYLKENVVIIFSKKGFVIEKLKNNQFARLIIFTENKHLIKLSKLRNNNYAYYTKFPKNSIDKFLQRNIEKYKKTIFKKNENAVLINVIFPRKNSRANSLSVISKKDFR
jgi:pyruvate kinase